MILNLNSSLILASIALLMYIVFLFVVSFIVTHTKILNIPGGGGVRPKGLI